jgi:hypothetical protein
LVIRTQPAEPQATHDYDRPLRLVIEGGTVNGVRILSPETANIFRVDQIAGLPKFRTPGGDG